jgi:hypothetical protein
VSADEIDHQWVRPLPSEEGTLERFKECFLKGKAIAVLYVPYALESGQRSNTGEVQRGGGRERTRP